MHAGEKKPRPKGTVAVAIQELRKTANTSAVYEMSNSGNESEGDDTKTANPSNSGNKSEDDDTKTANQSNSGNESEGDDTKSTSIAVHTA